MKKAKQDVSVPAVSVLNLWMDEWQIGWFGGLVDWFFSGPKILLYDTTVTVCSFASVVNRVLVPGVK